MISKDEVIKALNLEDQEYKLLYNRYNGIKGRCYSKSNAKYKNYGARGIYMDASWLEDKLKFMRDVIRLEGYSTEKLLNGDIQLDKDLKQFGSDHYGPDTCSWVSGKTNTTIKPSYMWWHRAYNIYTGEFVKFYNLHEFTKMHPDIDEKSVSTVTKAKHRGGNTGWLKGWYFWSEKVNSAEKAKVFVAYNVKTNETVYDYKVSYLQKRINIPAYEIYKMTSPAKPATRYKDWEVKVDYLSEETARKMATSYTETIA